MFSYSFPKVLVNIIGLYELHLAIFLSLLDWDQCCQVKFDVQRDNFFFQSDITEMNRTQANIREKERIKLHQSKH